MPMFQKIASNALNILALLESSPLIGALIGGVFGMCSLWLMRSILWALFEMHRSKTSLRKLNRNYSFLRRLSLAHIWQECLHAKKFAHCLICCSHARFAVMVVSTCFSVVAHNVSSFRAVSMWVIVVAIMMIDIPVFLLNLVLDTRPFRRGRVIYTFEKYNHTEERKKLL